MREDQEESKLELLDLDDEQGAEVCKTYLCSIERLMDTLGIALNSRSYRNDFTNSYKVLYRQMYEQFNSEAAYLPEILDSAQEAFDHLWVNGEKYVFSDHVVETGNLLFSHFTELRQFVSKFFQKYFEKPKRSSEEKLKSDFEKLKDMLGRFDQLWTFYEQKYVYELMVIESDARRFIIESVNIEAVLMQRHMQLTMQRATFNEKRGKLLENIC